MYEYAKEREKLFTDAGQRLFLEVRDNVKSRLKHAGAVRMQEAISTAGDSWMLLACVDRMVELGELCEVTQSVVMTQHRIFTEGR